MTIPGPQDSENGNTDAAASPEARVAELEAKLAALEQRSRSAIDLLRGHQETSLSRLAGNVSHDISNSLVAILGFSDLILTKMRADDPNYRAVQSIQEAGQRTSDLSRRLLEFSRSRSIQKQVFSPDHSLEAVVPGLTMLLPPETELRLQPGNSDANIKFDPELFDTIVARMAINGARLASEGNAPPCVTIRTGSETIKSFDEGVLSPGNYYTMSFTSTGHVATEEEQEDFCNPFAVGPTGNLDFGIGYAVAHKNLKLVGGNIVMQPMTDGTGTEVLLYFPMLPKRVSDSFPKLTDTDHGGTPALILLLESEEVVRKVVIRTLEYAGFTVLTAGNDQEAMDLLNDGSHRIDLILTSSITPGLENSRFTDRILHMSTDAGGGQLTGAPSAKIKSIAKPFPPGALVAKVYEILGINVR